MFFSPLDGSELVAANSSNWEMNCDAFRAKVIKYYVLHNYKLPDLVWQGTQTHTS